MQDYSQKVFGNYKLWAGISRFYGRIAEVGPGDVSGVADLLLADGCSHVDQIDRFRHERPDNPNVSNYLATAEEFFETHKGYDFILSCAVLEHVADPLRAVRAMAGALNPNGTMVHAIDCRDHNQFSDRLHDLSFLRIPHALYWPLTLASGLNRVRLSAYIELLHSLGLRHSVLVTSLSGIPEQIEPAKEFDALDPVLLDISRRNLTLIQERLARPFKTMPDRDLMISGFALIARRPLSDMLD